VRKIINFGYDMVKLDQVWLPGGSNYKMSDIAAAFIQSHLEAHLPSISKHHAQLWDQWKQLLGSNNGGVALWPNCSEEALVACITLLLPFPIHDTTRLEQAVNATVRKYYKPLDDDSLKYPVAHLLYSCAVCLPCHSQVSVDDVYQMHAALIQYVVSEQSSSSSSWVLGPTSSHIVPRGLGCQSAPNHTNTCEDVSSS
jgi:dTDP-4-amino-4,6-dideoxygalactose transaminase